MYIERRGNSNIATTEIYLWLCQQWKMKYKPGEFVQSVLLFVPKLVRPLSWASRSDQELLVKTPYRMQCHASEVVLSAYQPLLSALWSTVMNNKKGKKISLENNYFKHNYQTEKKLLVWIITIPNKIWYGITITTNLAEIKENRQLFWMWYVAVGINT